MMDPINTEGSIDQGKTVRLVNEAVEWFVRKEFKFLSINEQNEILDQLSANVYQKYWSLVEGIMGLRCDLAEAKYQLQTKAVVDQPSSKLLENEDGNINELGTKSWATFDALERVVDRAQASLDDLVDAWEKLHRDETNANSQPLPPRIIRLGLEFDLPRPELWAMHFLVLNHIGQSFPPSSSVSSFWQRGSLRNLSICCPSLSSSRLVLTFLSSDRMHVQQGIVTVEDDPISGGFDLGSVSIGMTRSALVALAGAPLTTDDVLALDGTVLEKVVKEEGEIETENQSDTDKPESSQDSIKVDPGPLDHSLEDANKDTTEDVDINELLEQLRMEENTKDQELENNPMDEEAEEDGQAQDGDLTPYIDDLDYLNDWFAVVAARLERLYNELEDETYFRGEAKNKGQIVREKKAKAKTALARAQRRLKLTAGSSFCPRLEKLAQLRNLGDFEKLIIVTLIGAVLSPEIVKILYRQSKHTNFTVGELLWLHHMELREQIDHRRYFYKTATLIRERIISIDEKGLGGSDLVDCKVQVDRRVLDYCVALDTEINCLVDGTVLTDPTTSMAQVVLPPNVKQLILQTVDSASQMESMQRHLGLDQLLDYGRGTVILLHGPSGVGKTMVARAVANHLKKRLILATLVSSADTLVDDLRLVFREGRIQNALVFLDECEGLFESRNRRGTYTVNRVLTEIERYDGLLILATNRPQDLDEALHRRISLSVEIPVPDANRRLSIWHAHVPPNVTVDPDVNFEALATEYELSGGFIKNALIMALLFERSASNSNGDDNGYRLTQRTLEQACLTQMQGQFEMDSQFERLLPTDLDERLDLLKCLRINSEAKDILERVVHEYRFRHKLTNISSSSPCISVLVLGSCQSGKTSCIRAIAAECHRPLVTMSLVELEQYFRYQTTRQKQTSVINDVFQSGAVLHVVDVKIDSSSGSLAESSGGIETLFRVLRLFKGVLAIELTCSTSQQRLWMRDGSEGNGRGGLSWFSQLVRRVGYVLRIDPSEPSAAALWRLCLDDESIDELNLAKRFPDFVIGEIEQVIRQAQLEVIKKDPSAQWSTEDVIQAGLWLQDKYRIAGAQQASPFMYA